MDRPEFLAALRAVHLTGKELAELVGANESTVKDWGSRYPVPYQIRLILWLLSERGGAHELLGRPPVDRLPRVHRLCE
jgi:DNA-binding transcriptional regulator YiaG